MIDQTTPPELFEKRYWYACRTKSRAEKKVQQQLSGGGVRGISAGQGRRAAVGGSEEDGCLTLVSWVSLRHAFLLVCTRS